MVMFLFAADPTVAFVLRHDLQGEKAPLLEEVKQLVKQGLKVL